MESIAQGLANSTGIILFTLQKVNKIWANMPIKGEKLMHYVGLEESVLFSAMTITLEEQLQEFPGFSVISPWLIHELI